MKIILFGSTYISELVEARLIKDGHIILGHVPSKSPTFPGRMTSPAIPPPIEPRTDYIKLSVQYDGKILDTTNAYNLHTGLLPEYGGCNILCHTIKNKETKQGLTFHRMTDKFDFGEIISTATYPVLPTDTVGSLYLKASRIAPHFASVCLNLLDLKGHAVEPKMYRRKDIDPEESAEAIREIKDLIK